MSFELKVLAATITTKQIDIDVLDKLTILLHMSLFIFELQKLF